MSQSEYNQQYYEKNKTHLNNKRTENRNKQKEREDEYFRSTINGC
jgi:hypothetical protein